jgi:2-polyprenyl-6-methoxyphenol hydroxylase-like FAD-dependent oxidoreductase
MAGLLCARVLADFFAKVLVIERDALPAEPMPRRGVPQSHQIHVLLSGGFNVLTKLFPGFVDEAVAHSASYACMTTSAKRFYVNAFLPRFDSDLFTLHCSRSLLEWLTRQRALQIPNVEFLAGDRLVGLVAGQEGRVAVETAASRASSARTTISCDLVVDATGRSSAAPTWLRDLGYDVPSETTLNAFWGYASRYYRMPRDWDPDYLVLASIPLGRDGDTRGGMLQRHEGDRWLCTLVGCAKDYPPGEEDAFRAFASSLPIPDYSAAIASAEPLSDIETWRQTANRLRRYDELETRPDNLLFVGDSVCALNPVYGQGMSVAALCAEQLQHALTERAAKSTFEGLAASFQQSIAETVQFPWSMACGADHGIPGVEGAAPAPEQVDFNERWERAMLLATEDPRIATLRLETQALVRSADWLYDGEVANRIVADWDRLGALLSSER